MRHFDLRLLLPSLWLAACVILASWAAVHASGPGWLVFGAPLLLALAVVSADIWHSRRRGLPPRPSAAALILAGAVVLAGLMIGSDDPRQLREFMPVLGVVAATSTLRGGRRANCLPSA